MTNTDPLTLTKELVAFESPSYRSNAEVSNFIADKLRSLGFDIELVEYKDPAGVTKVNVLGRKGSVDLADPGLAYFCHSDVVPAEDWSGPGEPFVPTETDGKLYGRGSCDMKGSAACMLAAIEQLGTQTLQAPIYFVCTADEELSYQGAHHVVEKSELYREMVARQVHVVIGEPTELQVVYAHKGVCELFITSIGEAAHSSTLDGLNANLAMIPFLQELKKIYDETETSPEWQNDEFDPPTMTMNIGINDHTKAINVKPAQSVCSAFLRPLPGIDVQPIIDRVQAAATKHGLELDVRANVGAVYTDSQDPFVQEATSLANCEKPITVSYGTDAGELSALQHKIICGPGSIAQAHKSDEWIDLQQLELGQALFAKFLERWCL